MSIEKVQGLKGLKGLYELSKGERNKFLADNADALKEYADSPMRFANAAEKLYKNQQFIDAFGEDAFKQYSNGTQSAYNMRNEILKDKIATEEYVKRYKGNMDESQFNKGMELSSDAKIRLLQSNYLTPKEFDKKWKKHLDEIDARGKAQMNSGAGAFMPLGAVLVAPVAASSTGNKTADAVRMIGSEESGKKYLFDKNQRIFDKIYGEDADNAARRLGDQVSRAYYDMDLENMSDDQVRKEFIKIITPGSYKDKYGRPNLGISEYASHYGNGSRGQITSEMQDFSIDDMRKIIAKKKVYDANMSPDMARTVLNNEAMRYIKEHQGKAKRFGLFMKDVGVSSMSYTADKLNGISELYRMGQDAMAEKPVVMMNDMGEILDPNKVKLRRNKQGGLYYKGKDEQIHSVHQVQMDYTTLHNMGKNPDGSDITGAFGIDWMTLNPVYWTRAEQFGTLDEGEQKQYEKLGSSPYKVAYNPNEEGDLWYEAFKMMSFGIADAMSQLVPFGIGAIGNSLSTASKVGSIAKGFGKVLDTTGKLLTAETKVGQVVQGTAGALGIAYAYNRGAFQETLAQNLANAEEAMTKTAQNDIYNLYNNDNKYKAGIDKLINARAATMKTSYLAQMQKDGGMKATDMKAIDKMIHAKAQDEVLSELVQKRSEERKASKEYADLQQKAIDGAGDAAFNSFLTEGVKYGLVNNLGHRKFLYQNPTGLTKKVSASLKGLEEITTKDGAKRLAAKTSKFLTKKDKWLNFGKTVVSQAWGGAWTNGTDDMQVDAAERINEDSFNRYLEAYQNGEALADTCGFVDGLYSYMKGLGNSLGQETTWNAAAVGALGSLVNFTPNFANIARLGTKEGREAYRNNFRREVRRDENGMPLRNEDGSIQYKELGKLHDWRGQFNYFIQNGVLNNYYGMKQTERDMQSHADYVNNILDYYNDFADIEHLVASNLASENIESMGDEKTLDFIKALHAVNTLNGLGRNSSAPATMSSVVQNAKTLIDKASKINLEEGKSPFNEDEISNLLSQYYSQHPEIPQNDYNNQKALYNIAQNATKLKEASEAYNKAMGEIQKIEKNRGEDIDPLVKTKMVVQQALDSHWKERVGKMQSDIGDNSSEGQTLDANTLIATVGGRENTKELIQTYNRQQTELEGELNKQKKKTEEIKGEWDNANTKLKEARQAGYLDDINELKKERDATKTKYEAAKEQERYIEDLISKTIDKRTSLQSSMEEAKGDESSAKLKLASDELSNYKKAIEDLKAERSGLLKKNGEPKKRYIGRVAEIDKAIADYEKNIESKEGTVRANREKVLTADEIFSLYPITRARMMKPANRELYSREQQREIEKLEQQLIMKDADALQKVQDIALLTQRIATNRDAYSRMAKNPEAAAMELEMQRQLAADNAHKMITKKSAQAIADEINQFIEGVQSHQDVSEEEKENVVYRNLRRYHSEILKTMDENDMLPKYKKQLQDALGWVKTTEDMLAIIKGSENSVEWKSNVLRNIRGITEMSNTREEFIANLEKVIDDTDGSTSAKDFEYILKGMENLGYQREATVLESREQRRKREAEEKKKKEEIKQRLNIEVKEAAQKKTDEVTPTEEGFTMGEGKDVPLGIFDDENGIENTDKGKTEGASNTEEKVTNVNRLMQDNITDGFINMGEMWYGTAEHPSKGNFVVTKGEGKITFSIDSKAETLDIDADNYTLLSDVESLETIVKDTPFKANSLEKTDEGWLAKGIFEGSNEATQVKVTKDFNLDQAIQKQKESREKERMTEGVDTGNKNLIVEEDTVQGKSETLKEQCEDTSDSDNNILLSEENADISTMNDIGQYNIDSDNISLSGNAMSEYKAEPLIEDGILERKKGNRPDDNRNKFFAWMDAAGIKLQNIIDQEVGKIIKANPHAKVKFMVIRPDNNATHDRDMRTHLMLVLDYDNSINKGITEYHNEANGGVIESNGKKYLVIGTVGYGKGNSDRLALYDILWGNDPKAKTGYGLVRRKYAKFFNEHPSERFYVNEELNTEVMPNYPIPGYIVRQQETDSHPEFRSMSELLDLSNGRNPKHLTWENMLWGIQEAMQFAITRKELLDQVMMPRNIMENLGRAFALIPASNGKLLPAYLKTLRYVEMHEGALKKEIDALLQAVVSPDYQRRLDAVIALSNIFYFNQNGDTILLRKGRGEISLVHNGKVQKTFILDSNFDRGSFIKAFEDINPRINVTMKVLGNIDLLKKYDEAGALMTDVALLHTAGSAYSIYALDGEGKMTVPQQVGNDNFKAANHSDFKNGDKSLVVFGHQYYRETSGVFYLNGKTITDENLITQLRYNR